MANLTLLNTSATIIHETKGSDTHDFITSGADVVVKAMASDRATVATIMTITAGEAASITFKTPFLEITPAGAITGQVSSYNP